MTIIVDNRENRSGNIESLKRRRCDVKVEQLEVGDYIIGDVVIERKDGADFLSSIRDKRIWNQAKNLSQAKHPIIAVIDNNIWKSMYFTGANWIHKSFYGALTKLTTSFGIIVLLFQSNDDFLRYVKTLDDQLDKEGTGIRPQTLMRKATKFSVRIEDALTSAKGISVKTSQILLKHFGTLKRVANASIDDLVEVEGIGKGKAQEIYNLFNNQYGDD